MVGPSRAWIVIVLAMSVVVGSAQQGSLTDDEVATAIRLGQQGKDFSVRVGRISGRSTYCDVIVDGPVARVSAAAADAFRQYRPFTTENVTGDMKASTYRITIRASRGEMLGCPSGHVVLQSAGATGMDGVIQPLQERRGIDAFFDHLPDEPFRIVVVTMSGEAHRVPVSAKDRTRIESPLLGIPEAAPARAPQTPVMPPPPPAAIPNRAAKSLRLFVQGDGKHLTDALRTLQAELATAGIAGTVVPRGEPYDYAVIFGEGDRHAAAAIALDTHGNVVASAVRGASFTDKGAADDAGRDLGKKLAALLR